MDIATIRSQTNLVGNSSKYIFTYFALIGNTTVRYNIKGNNELTYPQTTMLHTFSMVNEPKHKSQK